MHRDCKIKKVVSEWEIETIVSLAKEIIPIHYEPWVPIKYSEFFIEKYQSKSAVQEQIEQNFEYYLVEVKGQILGYFGFSIHPKMIYLSKIYFLKNSRGLGLGKISMDFIIKRTLDLGKSTIELIVNQNNARTIKFYKDFGFEITEDQTNVLVNDFAVKDYKMVLDNSH